MQRWARTFSFFSPQIAKPHAQGHKSQIRKIKSAKKLGPQIKNTQILRKYILGPQIVNLPIAKFAELICGPSIFDERKGRDRSLLLLPAGRKVWPTNIADQKFLVTGNYDCIFLQVPMCEIFGSYFFTPHQNLYLGRRLWN
jgi:hypothetical protein